MSQIETQDILSGAEDAAADGAVADVKFVPVAESIRYRKRAQSAEKKVEELSGQLAQAKTEATKISEQLKDVQMEQKLLRKLAAAGAVDLEAAVLIAKTRIEGNGEVDVDSVVEQIRKEKQYLFAGSSTQGDVAASRKTAGSKERAGGGQTVLERAAKRAATTGNRADLQKYLKLRRNFL
jgi:hypothetical protein